MKPALGDYLFYTAPDESDLKPGPWPCVVVQPADGRLSVVVFGPGATGTQRLFDVDPKDLSKDASPYKAPSKSAGVKVRSKAKQSK